MKSRVLVFCLVFWCASGQKCGNPHTFGFQITHTRNGTGHWVAQVTMDQTGSGDREPDWTLNVQHTTSNCDNSQQFKLVATATGPSRSPDPNYELVPGLGYYRFHPETIMWPAARETCAREGAHLLILNSEDEYAAIRKIWDRYPNIATDWRNNFIHLGLTDHVQEKQFYTLFGEHINTTGYANWAANEPDSGPGANCAGVNNVGTLQDSSCNNLLAFVCEKSL